jgi:RNA polymerase sigma factor (sigma-70 family)
MEMTTDPELLRHFARTNSEDAFAELVKRHVNLVYAAALRQVNGDDHLARDVAQTVFTDLARKAGSLAGRENLAGWLYTSAHFAAAKTVRGETRRRDREEEFMREPANETAPDADWERIRPALDAAMHELKEADREALLLRYFENRQFAEVGAKLGLNENAARMRVERALEKLRLVFAKRGITTAATLASVLSVHAIQTAPVQLAATLTAGSLTTTGTGTFTLLKIMTATKLKLGLSVLLAAGAATALVVQHQAQEQLRQQNALLQQQEAQLQTEKADLSHQLANVSDSSKLTDAQFNELLKLRGEVSVLRQQTGELAKLRDQNSQLQTAINNTQNQATAISTADKFRLQEWHTIDTMKYLGLSMNLYASDHSDTFPTNFDQLAEELGDATNATDRVPLDTFEFVNAGLVSRNYPQAIMLRERAARQTPDGQWEREYGLTDGSVQTEYSKDGNFDAYEQQHMVPQPTNP